MDSAFSIPLNDIPLSALFGALFVMIILSALFSGSETGMMAINRYRLRHRAKQGHKAAVLVQKLLDRPDRLIGLILLGNNFVNIMASSLATVIALRLIGEAGIAVAAGLLTLVILIFSEVAPKTVAALYPEKFAFPAAYVLTAGMLVFSPLVYAINWVANGLLGLLGISVDAPHGDRLNTEELRTIVNEAGSKISRQHQSMLLSILDLEKVTVDDIMVPRAEIDAIDLNDEEEEILEQLTNSQHTRIPLFRDDIDNLLGILHIRRIMQSLEDGDLDKTRLEAQCEAPYFIPSETPLHTQLSQFQKEHKRAGLVVNEYGDIQGLATVDDILEEIVGQFTTDPADQSLDVYPQDDGSFLLDGSANIRELNRTMGWGLPTQGPKTLNGLILESLEDIPKSGTGLLIADYPVEIVHTADNAVKTARITPRKIHRRLADADQ